MSKRISSLARDVMNYLVLGLALFLAVTIYLLVSIEFSGFVVIPGLTLIVAIVSLICYRLFKSARSQSNAGGSGFWLNQGRYGLCYWVLCIMIGEIWASVQVLNNDARGRIIADACEEFRERNGSYPTSIERLKGEYLVEIPEFRRGLMSYQFLYWQDSAGQANLKYPLGLFTGRFWDFNSKNWNSDTFP